jgi:hypothetical protein
VDFGKGRDRMERFGAIVRYKPADSSFEYVSMPSKGNVFEERASTVNMEGKFRMNCWLQAPVAPSHDHVTCACPERRSVRTAPAQRHPRQSGVDLVLHSMPTPRFTFPGG